MRLENIIKIDVNKLQKVLSESYQIQSTSKFESCNLELSSQVTPSYKGKAWSMDKMLVANLSIPKNLLRKATPFEEYANNLVFGVLKAMFDCRSKDYEKDIIKDAFQKIGLTISKNAKNQRTVSGKLPIDVLQSIDVPPEYLPRKTKGTKQIKFSCCDNVIYIADTKSRPAHTVASQIVCDICGKAYSGDTAETIDTPRIDENLFNA